MPVIYSTAVKTARMEAVVDEIGSSGVLQIGTAGMSSILAEFSLESTAGTVAGAVLTLSGFPKSDTDANNGGTAAAARILDGSSNNVVSGLTVGTSAADIILDSVAITQGQTVTISSAAFNHAPDPS